MIQRGDVYFADMDPVRGREQAGRRPVLVVSADELNRQSLVVTIVTGTTARRGTRAYRTNVLVPSAESGLPRDTVFLCFQIRSIDPVRFLHQQGNAAQKVGRLGPARMADIDLALRRVIAL